MSESIIFQGLSKKDDPEFSELCLGLISLCNTAQIGQKIIQHVLPNLNRDDLKLIQNNAAASIPIVDKDIIRVLCGLKEASQIQLEDTLTDLGVSFGFSLALILAKSDDPEAKCFFLEIQKFNINEGPLPDDKPDGDDNVDPHAEIEIPRPMVMAMAAGA